MKLQPLFRKIFQIFCGFFGALFPAFFFARYFSVYRIFENLFFFLRNFLKFKKCCQEQMLLAAKSNFISLLLVRAVL